jgi:hypothetical protein
MAYLLSYEKIGFRFVLRVEDPEWLDLALKLQSCARVGQRPAANPDATSADLAWVRRGDDHFAILLRGEVWLDGISSPEGLYLQSDHLLDELAREAAAGTVFLHAGAVVSPRGAGIVVSGDSGAGKTSLVTACIARGWQWLSDEALCFDPADPQAMKGLKRNFNLKRRAFVRFPELAGLPDTLDIAVADARGVIRFFNPESFRPQQHLPAARLHHLVFPEYQPHSAPPRLAPLTQLEAAARIGTQLQGAGATSFAWLAAATRQCLAQRLIYHDPHQAVDLLAGLPLPAAP